MVKYAFVALALAGCFSTAHPAAQVVTLGPSPAPPWSALRDALDDCAQNQGLAGELRVRIDIDDDGGPGEVSANVGGAQLAGCIGKEISRMRFPADHRGRSIEVPYTPRPQQAVN
jgi:hypothetical protein